MKVARGDVVLIAFPQSPGQKSKRRPALVVQCDRNNARLENAIFAMITTNTPLVNREEAQLLMDFTTRDGQQSGLAHNSAVKCENLHTLPQSTVSKKLGSLPDSLLRQVDQCLQASLGL